MNPESEIWCSKGFPLYDEILPLVEGRHATGELVYHAPEPNSSIAGDFGHENRDDVSNSAHDDIPEELYDWPPSVTRLINDSYMFCIILMTSFRTQ